MECPRCGSGVIGFQSLSFVHMTGYVCQDCGLKWLELGPPRPLKEMRRVVQEYFAAWQTYCWHGLVVWSVATLLHFLAVVVDPFDVPWAMPAKGWGVLLLLTLATGVCLGWTLLGALELAGRYWPHRQALHVLFPLVVAACVGGLYGSVIAGISISEADFGISVCDPTWSAVLGVLLALAATPVIIVRSVAVLRKKGFRPPLKQVDPRWRS